jgi:hypothetical protein
MCELFETNFPPISISPGQATIIATQEVLPEVLAHFSGHGRSLRRSAATSI